MPTQASGSPEHFLVVVPGIMGSKLRDRESQELIWLNLSSLSPNPFQWNSWLDERLSRLVYSRENNTLEPAGLLDEVVFALPWVKQEQYSRLADALAAMGYQIDPSRRTDRRPAAYTFAYDWRQDNRLSAEKLRAAVDGWRQRHPGAKVWIIAHSMGGLVSRWYIEKLEGKEHVGRLFLMGSPWDGAPKALYMLFNGFDTLFRRRFNLLNLPQRTRKLVRTFPSVYQLLPYKNPFLRASTNEVIDLYGDATWLDNDTQRQMLLDGRQFNQDLGTTPSVETVCFFGRKQQTTTSGLLHLAAGGRWNGIEWGASEMGDGTVPERSAVHPQASAKLPFAAGHGDIYVHAPALEFLRWELIDKFHQPTTDPDRAAIITDRLQIVFEPEQDFYSPGERINLWATLNEIKRSGNGTASTVGRAVSEAIIEVALLWRQALPGDEKVAMPDNLSTTRLWESNDTLGRYEGSLVAPQTPGYYQLRATIQAPGEPGYVLEELIAVETPPDVSIA